MFGFDRVDRDVGRAGVRVLLQDLLPGLAAVAGAVDAALGIGTERRGRAPPRTRCRHSSGARPSSRSARPVPDVRPGLAGVGRLVDAVARRDVAADVGLARADVDDVRVAGRDGDRSDRARSAGRRTPASRSCRRRRHPHAARGGRRVVDEGSPGTPATRDTRPPAGGPTRRYLRPASSFGPLRSAASSARSRLSTADTSVSTRQDAARSRAFHMARVTFRGRIWPRLEPARKCNPRRAPLHVPGGARADPGRRGPGTKQQNHQCLRGSAGRRSIAWHPTCSKYPHYE